MLQPDPRFYLFYIFHQAQPPPPLKKVPVNPKPPNSAPVAVQIAIPKPADNNRAS